MNNYIRTTNGDVKSKILYIGERSYYKSSYTQGPGNLRLHHPGLNIQLPRYSSDSEVISNPDYLYCGGYELIPNSDGSIKEMASFITSGTQSTASVSCFGCFKGSFNSLLKGAAKRTSYVDESIAISHYYLVLAIEPVINGTRVCLELTIKSPTLTENVIYEMAIKTITPTEWASFGANSEYDVEELNNALSDYFLDNDSLSSAIAISIYNTSENDGLSQVQEAQVRQLSLEVAGSVQADAVLANEDFKNGVFEQVERASIAVNNAKFASV